MQRNLAAYRWYLKGQRVNAGLSHFSWRYWSLRYQLHPAVPINKI